MRRFENMSVARKVIAALSLVLLVTVSLGVFAVDRLSQVNTSAAEIRDNWLVATGALGRMGQTAIRFRQLKAAHILARSAEGKAKEENTMASVLQESRAAWAEY